MAVARSSAVESPYWNPKMECAPRAELRRVQLHKLQVLVRHAYGRSPSYRRHFDKAGFHPEQLKSLDDLRRIPFLTKEDMLAEQRAAPLYGGLYTCDADLCGVRYAQTSGTSGKTPFRVVDSTVDLDWSAETWAIGLYAFGVRRRDVAYLAFGYGPFIGFWGAHASFEKMGCVVVPGGAQTSEGRVKQIIDLGVTTVVSTPTYALRLMEVAQEQGIDLAASRVNKLIHAGEPGANIPSTKRALELGWGAKVGDFAGMTESSGIFSFECDRQPGGMHLVEDHSIEEILDPVTFEPLGYGQQGERVATSFGRTGMPLIRFRTGDLVMKVEGAQCSCGRTYDILRGGILGRVDDMKLIRGTNVYPAAVEGIVRGFAEITEFQIVIERVDNRDEITVCYELTEAASRVAPQALATRLRKELAEGHEGLRFNVKLVEPNSLPRFDMKARRLVDKRPKWTPAQG